MARPPAKRAPARAAAGPLTDVEIRQLRALLERPAPRANPPIVIGPFDDVPAPGSPIRSDWPQDISTYVANLRHDQLKELADDDHPQYLRKAAFYNTRADLYADQTSRLAVYFPPGTTGLAVPGIIATRSAASWYGVGHFRRTVNLDGSGISSNVLPAEVGLTTIVAAHGGPEWSGTSTSIQYGHARVASNTIGFRVWAWVSGNMIAPYAGASAVFNYWAAGVI